MVRIEKITVTAAQAFEHPSTPGIKHFPNLQLQAEVDVLDRENRDAIAEETFQLQELAEDLLRTHVSHLRLTEGTRTRRHLLAQEIAKTETHLAALREALDEIAPPAPIPDQPPARPADDAPAILLPN